MTGEVTSSEASPGRSDPNGVERRQRHRPFFYIGGTFLNAVVFAAVGPLVGGPVFAAVGVALTPNSSSLHDSSTPRFLIGLISYFYLFFITVPVSYYVAATAAFATGAAVAIFSVWLTYSRYLYLVAAIMGGLISILQVSRSPKFSDSPSLYAAAVAGAVAAMVCTRVAKPFRLGVPVPAEPADGRPAS